jgi:hypothetical protein
LCAKKGILVDQGGKGTYLQGKKKVKSIWTIERNAQTWNEDNQNLFTICNPFSSLLVWPIWIQRITRHLAMLKISFPHQWKYCLMKVIGFTSSVKTCLSIVSHTQTILPAKVSLVSKAYKYLKVEHLMH